MKLFKLITVSILFSNALFAQQSKLIHSFYDTSVYKIDTTFLIQTKENNKVNISVFRDVYRNDFTKFDENIYTSPFTIVATNVKADTGIFYKKFDDEAIVVLKNTTGKTFIQLTSNIESPYTYGSVNTILSSGNSVFLSEVFKTNHLTRVLYNDKEDCFLIIYANSPKSIELFAPQTYTIERYNRSAFGYDKKVLKNTKFTYPSVNNEIEIVKLLKSIESKEGKFLKNIILNEYEELATY